MQIKPIRKKKSILFKLHNLLYMDVIFIFIIYYCNILASLSLIILLTKKIQKKFCEGKYVVFQNIEDYFILEMKISKFIDYSTNMC